VDGATLINREWITKFQQLLESEKPDIVFTQWPIDTHPDHQMASLLTVNAWIRSGKQSPLYFYEVCNGEQTLSFRPTDYVDITSTQETKRKAIYCHVSQSPEAIYDCGHRAMEQFRGLEAGTKAAEAFISASGKGLGAVLAHGV
jgi:LmbE family N-acetylglucosaminyl deacetylase